MNSLIFVDTNSSLALANPYLELGAMTCVNDAGNSEEHGRIRGPLRWIATPSRTCIARSVSGEPRPTYPFTSATAATQSCALIPASSTTTRCVTLASFGLGSMNSSGPAVTTTRRTTRNEAAFRVRRMRPFSFGSHSQLGTEQQVAAGRQGRRPLFHLSLSLPGIPTRRASWSDGEPG
jgi:hypothetical protein